MNNKRALELQPNAFLKRCPSRAILARIGDKWSLLIMAALEKGPVRFGYLKKQLEGISQKVLTQTLRSLERDGYLEREVVPGDLLHVEYTLTSRGGELLALVTPIKKWAETHMRDILLSNSEYQEPESSLASASGVE